jgi:hypothetical protein
LKGEEKIETMKSIKMEKKESFDNLPLGEERRGLC